MSFTVFIETGLHAGAVQRLEPGLYTIGSELDSDVVLSDPGVESVHAILDFGDTGLRLEPAKGAIAIHGESGRLEPGDERHLTLPAKFSIGDTTISIRAPKDAMKLRVRKRYAMAGMAAAVLGVVGLYAIGPLSGSFAPPPGSEVAGGQHRGLPETVIGQADTTLQDRPAPVEPLLPGPAATAPKLDPVVTVDIAAQELRSRLAASSLTSIEVIVRKDHLLAKGTAEAERMADWQSVQMWFDGEYGRDVSLVPQVEPAEKAKPPALAIEAIWAGETPYLMAGGRRYFEGAKIGDGWTIESIKPEQITLSRGDQSFSITL